jgi:hypothetical protein
MYYDVWIEVPYSGDIDRRIRTFLEDYALGQSYSIPEISDMVVVREKEGDKLRMGIKSEDFNPSSLLRTHYGGRLKILGEHKVDRSLHE